jgi:glycosyltransferase involved in cell wall biosynthesis
MPSTVGSITRSAIRTPDEPLNILCMPTHERYESGLCQTGHNFFAYRAEGIKDWNANYAPLPVNYRLLDPAAGDGQLPAEVDFDLILSQNKFGQFQHAWRLSRMLHLPLVSLEHTLPVKDWPAGRVAALKKMKGDLNVFISEYSRGVWGWQENEAEVVHHGVDTDLFHPGDKNHSVREAHALSVVNDWVNRNWCCGFQFWQEATKGLPVRVVGDTPGLSKPAASMAELVGAYQQARVFVNTSLISPVPTALLEAMACGCCVISTKNCMIPEIVTHGVNGFLADDPKQMRALVQECLAEPATSQRVGKAARQTIRDRFAQDDFVRHWQRLFQKAAATPFLG